MVFTTKFPHRSKFLSVIIGVVFTVLVGVFPPQAYAATTTIGPSDNLSTALSSLSAGDTLILQDGVYTTALVVNNSGTSGNPITIRAENDGGAIIDGQDTLSHAVELNGDYIHLQGITARDTTSHVLVIDGSNIEVKRVAGYNANPNGNFHVWVVGGSDVLIEDSVGAGSGRYMFLAYEADSVTFRRCFAYWTNHVSEDAPRSTYGIYGSSNVSIINSIGRNVVPQYDNNEIFSGVFITKNSDPTQLSPENATVKGSIFSTIWQYGIIANHAEATNLLFENNLLLRVKDTPCVHNATCNINTAGIFTYLSQSGTVKNNTFVGNEYALWMSNTVHSIINNNFVENQWAHRGSDNTSHSYTNLWNNTNTSAATWTLNSSTLQVDPGYNTTKYGDGAYLFTSSTSPLYGTGNSGANIGADILYAYGADGNLSTTRLWPWPLEDRIVTETTRELGDAVSPTWASDGGLWLTLDGVYASPAPSPSPSSNGSGSSGGGNGGGGGGGSPGAPVCHDAVPDGVVDLFQIDRRGSEALLHFTPGNKSIDTYHVVFGYKVGDERYGGISMKAMNGGEGVQSLRIDHLDPARTYWFKIIPSRGCAPGIWSNWLEAKGRRFGKTWKMFYRYTGK